MTFEEMDRALGKLLELAETQGRSLQFLKDSVEIQAKSAELDRQQAKLDREQAKLDREQARLDREQVRELSKMLGDYLMGIRNGK